jgi:hypothetical protein
MIASGCAVSAATACSSPDLALEVEAKKTTQASSVTVAMFDKSGNELGSCSGTLVAKDLVLTAGHCAAGAAKWKVTSKSANTTAEASKAVTPWKAFGSDLSHPDHSDVAVIVLDSPIALDRYPGVATSKMADGTQAVRFSRASASASEAGTSTISVSSARSAGFRLNYAAKVEKGGFVDTGGAIIDPSTGKIHGVVSGIGKESGMLHIARTDNFAKWITKAVSCAAATTATTTRTYPGGGSSSGGSSSGGWGSGGGDWGGYGGSGAKLDGGVSSSSGGSTTDGGTTSSGGTTSGSSGSSGGTPGAGGGTPGSSGGTPGAGGSDTSGSASSCPGVPTCEGNDCPGKKSGSGSSGSSGSDGATPGSGSGGTTSGGTTSGGTPSGGTPSGGTTSGGTTSGANGATPGGNEVCPGPPSCPEADSQSCVGAACGGCAGIAGCVDATIDYGSCASCGSSGTGGKGPVVR